MSCFLGYVYQSTQIYILDVLLDACLSATKPVATLLPNGPKFDRNFGELIDNPSFYQRLVGRLLYIILIRPDISHVVHNLSQFLLQLRVQRLNALFHLLRYLKGLLSLGLFHSSSNDL